MSTEQANGHSDAPLLELSKVTKYFGGLAAVQDVDLQVRPKQIAVSYTHLTLPTILRV